jgi:hypothetical protein
VGGRAGRGGAGAAREAGRGGARRCCTPCAPRRGAGFRLPSDFVTCLPPLHPPSRRPRRPRPRDGHLALAATRGDGREGEDVTHNAATGAIAGLPVALNLAAAPGAEAGGKLPRELEVRGEVYISKGDFEAVSLRV